MYTIACEYIYIYIYIYIYLPREDAVVVLLRGLHGGVHGALDPGRVHRPDGRGAGLAQERLLSLLLSLLLLIVVVVIRST